MRYCLMLACYSPTANKLAQTPDVDYPDLIHTTRLSHCRTGWVDGPEVWIPWSKRRIAKETWLLEVENMV